MNTPETCQPFAMLVESEPVEPPPGPEIIFAADDIVIAIDHQAVYVDTDRDDGTPNVIIKRNL